MKLNARNITRLTKRLKRRLRLRDWDIEWTVDGWDGARHWNAYVETVAAVDRATIHLRWERIETFEQLHRHLVHEHLHVFHRRTSDLAQVVLRDSGGMTAAAFEVFDDAYRTASEIETEKMARILSALWIEEDRDLDWTRERPRKRK